MQGLEKEIYQSKVSDELGDGVIYCYKSPLSLGVSLDDIYREKLDKIKVKYPAEVVKNNSRATYQIKLNNRNDSN